MTHDPILWWPASGTRNWSPETWSKFCTPDTRNWHQEKMVYPNSSVHFNSQTAAKPALKWVSMVMAINHY